MDITIPAGAAIPATGLDTINDRDWTTSLFTGGHNIIINNNRYAPGYIERTAADTFGLVALPGWETTYPTGRTNMDTFTTARTVRGIGNRILAGNIGFRDNNTDPTMQTLVGSFPGTLRISALAPPGAVPVTWDPFDVDNPGADEFELSNTSPIVDIVALQGQAMVYTTDSIHSVTFQGNDAIVRQVADGYGALTTGSILEFDGRHFVVGSNDLYIFGGHPGSIQSVADAKIREFFFGDVNPLADVQENMFLLRDSERDEIQIYYPSVLSTNECDRYLAWNYRNNTWSINDANNVISGTVGPIRGGGIANTEARFDGGTEFPDVPKTVTANDTSDVGSFERQTITIPTGTYEAPLPEQQTATFAGTAATTFDDEEFTLAVGDNIIPGSPETANFLFSNDFSSGTPGRNIGTQTGTAALGTTNNIGTTPIDLTVATDTQTRPAQNDITTPGTYSSGGS